MERYAAGERNEGVIRVDDGVELRPARMEHADALFAAVERNRDRLRQWLPWVVDGYSIESTRRFLADCERENAAKASLTTVIWSKGEICGAIGLHRIEMRHRSTSIGYWIDAACEGQGIVTNACRAIVDEGFRSYGLHRIEIRCATGNRRSGAIPQRLGFVEEGVLREAEWLYDRWVDLRVFSMLEQHWAIA
jgi:ribosomal-protein-serine acetyltransferase